MTQTADRIQQRLNTTTTEVIAGHLTLCDAAFAPPLSQRVDIRDYATKLSAKAERFEAWDGAVLIGLVAAYPDQQRREMFITSVSVLPEWRRHGLAAGLVRRCVMAARELNMETVTLEVGVDNVAAERLYSELGFLPSVKGSGGAPMRLTLKL